MVLIALSPAFAGGPATLAEAVKGLRSPSRELRAASEEFVLKAGPSALREVALSAASERGRLAAQRIVVQMGEKAIPELLKLLDDAEARIPAGGLLFQALGPKNVDLVPALVDCLRGKPAVKNYCGTSLVKVMSKDGAKHVPLLAEALQDSDREVRIYAAGALGRLEGKGKAAVPALAEALKDADSTVRLTAAASLGKLGGKAKEALPALEQAAAADANEAVRRQAKEAVSQING